MNESKLKRIVGAATVTAVLLVVILLAIMIYQLIAISNEANKKNELDAAIVEYHRLIEETGESIETRSQRWWIEQRARELGYRFVDDVLYDK